MRSIVLHIHEDDCLEARLQAALDLARQFDGHLTCLQAIPYDYGVPGDFYGVIGAELAMEFTKEARRVREKYEARLEKEDVRWDWHVSDGSAMRLVSHYGPLSDLVVLGARNPIGRTDSPSVLVSDLVGQLRAPMLVMPCDIRSISSEAPVTIAWNGSAEAAHAMVGAMPLLLRASEVHILTVSEDEEKEQMARAPRSAAEYLARHDIEAEIVEISHAKDDEESISEKLVSASQSRDAAALVMGAYGHSRLRERVLGGVTRDMLSDPAIPLLLSH